MILFLNLHAAYLELHLGIDDAVTRVLDSGGYPIPLHMQGAYADLGLPPHAHDLAGEVQSLPMGSHLGEEAARQVVEALT